VIRDLVEVASAYDSVGDGCVNISELLSEALEVEPGLVDFARVKPVLPAFMLVCWFALGLGLYSHFGWSFRESLHFIVMSMLTIGQESVIPDSDEMKLLSAFYVLAGVSMIAWIGCRLIGRVLMNAQERILAVLYAGDLLEVARPDGAGSQLAYLTSPPGGAPSAADAPAPKLPRAMPGAELPVRSATRARVRPT
jgi:hypothetical protein